MPTDWTDEQKRMYEHILSFQTQSGVPKRTAREVAARTAQPQRAAGAGRR